jgi:hypothetical protein
LTKTGFLLALVDFNDTILRWCRLVDGYFLRWFFLGGIFLIFALLD